MQAGLGIGLWRATYTAEKGRMTPEPNSCIAHCLVIPGKSANETASGYCK